MGLRRDVRRDSLVEGAGQGGEPCPFSFSPAGPAGAFVRIRVRSALQWLADTRLARRLVETLFRSKARLRMVELDHQSVARCQNRTLLGLVHKAHTTRFGKDHDLCRIRNASDFRRLVPLRTPAELWREYWQPAYPKLEGATWPGPIPYLAVSASEQSGAFPYIPVSPALWAAQQAAALTALAFVMHARPRARLCEGRLCFLGSGTQLSKLGAGPSESLEAVAIRQLPEAFRPLALSQTCEHSEDTENSALAELAGRSIRTPVTCIAGTGGQLRRFFADAKRLTGARRIVDVWPSLAAVLCARSAGDFDRRALVADIGSSAVLLQELYIRQEGAIAIEDPRLRALRLLPDQGVYFEFVPADQVGKARPARCSAAEVRLDVPYALAISSPAGIWACLVGSVVQFERLRPPLLQLVETDVLWKQAQIAGPAAKVTKSSHAFPGGPPHPRTFGKEAAHPGKPFRIPLSARADRG